MTANADALVNQRDQGLVRAVGPIGLTANVVNYTIGASIFVMPASAASLSGAWAPIAFLIAAIATFAITLCYAEAGARVPTSGGQAGFTEVAFGSFAGFLAGGLTYVANLLAAGAITAAAVDMASAALPILGSQIIRSLVILAWGVLLFVLVGGRVRQAARFVSVATAIKIVPLALLLIVGLIFVDPVNLQRPQLPIPSGLGQTTLLAIFLFAGVHGALLASGEVKDPARTVPKALLAGMAIVTFLFIGCQLAAQGILGECLSGSHAPLADAIAVASPVLGTVMAAGALLSMLGWTASDALSTPRSLFALAQDGYLPKRLGLLDRETHSPRAAIAIHLLFVALLASTGTFATLAATCAVVLVLLLGGACLAALRLRQRAIALGGPVRPLPGLTAAATVGTLAAFGVGAQANATQLAGTAAILAVLSIAYVLTLRQRMQRSNGSAGYREAKAP